MQITVTKTDTRWEARFPFSYETKDLVKGMGFRFDANRKVWFTEDPVIAKRLESTESLKAHLEAERAKVEASRATDADIDIPVPAGLSLLPYQKAGVAYALEREATLIGDEMGLGKTVQGVAFANALGAKNVLIICPASLKNNWAEEWKRWDVNGLSVRVINGKGITAGPNDPLGFAGVVIVNYEQVKKHRADIDLIDWDLLICDEVHYMKSSSAQRKQYVLGKWDDDPAKRINPINAKRRLFLTGTPIVNRPYEMWPLVRALDPQGLGKSWKYYTNRYCAAYHNGYGMDLSGASNLEELQERARKAFMVRRLKVDVLKDLPPKRRTVVALEANAQQRKALAAEAKVLTQHAEALKALQGALDYEERVAQLRMLHKVAFEEISRVRHNVAVEKVSSVIEFVRERLEEVDKVVVMAHHHDVIDALASEFGSAMSVVVDGRTPIDQRQLAVKRFQEERSCRVFIGGMRAAGVGLTLTASSTVVFAELDWTPGNISQAEDRCHRIGQRDMVNIYHVVLDGSLDARMAKIVVAKQDVLDKTLDKVPAAERAGRKGEGDNAEFPSALKRVSLPTIVTDEEQPEVKDPKKEAQRDAVHMCLRILAGMCDGAHTYDGAGFNKYDAKFGHDLANADRLSDNQVKAAAKMIVKYKRQLPGDLLARARGE